MLRITLFIKVSWKYVFDGGSDDDEQHCSQGQGILDEMFVCRQVRHNSILLMCCQ